MRKDLSLDCHQSWNDGCKRAHITRCLTSSMMPRSVSTTPSTHACDVGAQHVCVYQRACNGFSCAPKPPVFRCISLFYVHARSATLTIPDLKKSSTLVKSCVLGSSSVRDHRRTLKLHSSDGLAIFNSNMLIRLKYTQFSEKFLFY